MKIGIVGAGNVGCACAMAATVCGSAREIVLITSQVFLWSSVRIAGVPVAELLKKRGQTLRNLREKVEREVRYDNIIIIEGHDASQYRIGIVCARIAEIVLNDERAR